MIKKTKQLALYRVNSFDISLDEYKDSYILRYSSNNKTSSCLMLKDRFNQSEAFSVFYNTFQILHSAS